MEQLGRVLKEMVGHQAAAIKKYASKPKKRRERSLLAIRTGEELSAQTGGPDRSSSSHRAAQLVGRNVSERNHS